MLTYALTTTLGYFGVMASIDLIEYKLGIPVWDQTKRTAACYDWFEQYLQNGYDKNKDYSEGLFDGNYNLTLEQATTKKYEYIFEKLGLKPGMKLLDAGCGTGVWMEFCRQRGIDVVGLTLSPEQAKEVSKKGLAVHVMDYRVMNESFLNQFDRITALGSSEHVCSSLGSLKGDTAATRCNKERIDVWNLFHQYLKPDGKVYVTVLTVNSEARWSSKDWMQAYILERHYGGYYSSMEDIAEKVVPKTPFNLTDIQDKTKDYHWSSVADKDHFGHWTINWKENTFNKVSYIVKGVATDPFLVHHWMYYLMDSWMWQFGGYQPTPLTDEQVSKAPAQLKYFMLEKGD